ncbi:MAG: hypothetical protein R2712_17780 [Vicinamibacterales bacterium]
MVGVVSGGAAPAEIQARALAAISLVAAVVAVFLLYRVFAALVPVRGIEPAWMGLDPVALGAVVVTMTSPLLWTLAVRPMSDLPGFGAGAGVAGLPGERGEWQTPGPDGDRRLSTDMLVASGRMIVLRSLFAGTAIGLRTQTLWLTAPVLLLVLLDRVGRGVAGALMGAVMASAIGALAWAVPLVIASGGLTSYTALGVQAGEDFASGEMLYQPRAAPGGDGPGAHVRGPVGRPAARDRGARAGGRGRGGPPRRRAPHAGLPVGPRRPRTARFTSCSRTPRSRGTRCPSSRSWPISPSAARRRPPGARRYRPQRCSRCGRSRWRPRALRVPPPPRRPCARWKP